MCVSLGCSYGACGDKHPERTQGRTSVHLARSSGILVFTWAGDMVDARRARSTEWNPTFAKEIVA